MRQEHEIVYPTPRGREAVPDELPTRPELVHRPLDVVEGVEAAVRPNRAEQHEPERADADLANEPAVGRELLDALVSSFADVEVAVAGNRDATARTVIVAAGNIELAGPRAVSAP